MGTSRTWSYVPFIPGRALCYGPDSWIDVGLSPWLANDFSRSSCVEQEQKLPEVIRLTFGGLVRGGKRRPWSVQATIHQKLD